MRLLCIDPGTEVSGCVGYHPDRGMIQDPEPAINNWLLAERLEFMRHQYDHLAIEMIASYGMAVGKTTFETCVWIGRFMELFGWDRCTKIYRKDVKLELCGSPRAKDANVRQALLDLFPATGGGETPQIGTKPQPGPLYGVSKHAVSALAVGVTYAAIKGYDPGQVHSRTKARVG